MLTPSELMKWVWAWFWYAWWQIFRPLWKLPVWLGFEPSLDQFCRWGDVLGIFFAIKHAWPVVIWLDARTQPHD